MTADPLPSDATGGWRNQSQPPARQLVKGFAEKLAGDDRSNWRRRFRLRFRPAQGQAAAWTRALEASSNLPDLDVIAGEIADDLQAALDQFTQIASNLKN